MGNIKITQIKSSDALGIKKLHNPVIKVATPQIMGMVAKVKHLIIVEEC